MMVRQKVQYPVLQLTRNDLNSDETGPIDIISDASVHVQRREGAVTWCAVNERDRIQSVDRPIEVYDDSYSYRQEMLGVYYGLEHSISTLPKVEEFRSHCDNEAGIKKMNEPLVAPGQAMRSDMDIVLATHNLIKETGKTVSFHHVEGHVEKKRPGEKPTRLEAYNQMCDEEAGLCVEEKITPTKFTPLKGSRCMIKIGEKWVTSEPDKAIERAFSEPSLKEYTIQRLKLSAPAAALLEYKHFLHVRSTYDWHRIARSSKMLFGWLPVGHNWRHHGADNDLCPCCSEPDETFIHLLQCTSTEIVELRIRSFRRMKLAAISARIPRAVYSLAEAMWQSVCNNTEPNTINVPPALQNLMNDQLQVGLHHFVIGWFVKSWAQAMHQYGSRDQNAHVAQLLTILWDGLCEPIWELRNNILHNKPNPTTLRETESLRDKLRWYSKYKSITIAPRHYFLTNYTNKDIDRWNRDQCRVQLKILANAQNIFEIECRQRMRGQRVITDFFNQSRT
jgi:hypothetical protein